MTAPRRRPPGRRRSRLLLALVALTVAAVAATFVTGWFDRSGRRGLELGAPARVVVVNQAGPLEVVEAAGPVRVDLRSSYLFTGPRLETATSADGAVARASCPGWAPCRVSLRVRVPPGTAVEAVAPGHVVTVGTFTGELSVTVTDHGAASLGPVSGPLRVLSASSPIRVPDLASGTASIRSGSGAVEVVARVPPAELTVRADTAPVRLTLAPAAYRLELDGDPVVVEGLEPVRRRRHLVTVDTSGPVTVRAGAPDG